MIARTVYLASRYSNKPKMLEHAATLVSYGMEVTSRWLAESHAPSMDMVELDEATNRQIAMDDLEDVANADMMIFFCEDRNNQPPRGGRHVEFGYALALSVRVVCIGDRENIFHYLPNITHYRDFSDFVEKELAL